MLPSFCNQEITRIRPGTTTARGSTLPDLADDKVTKLVIKGCSVQPASTSLTTDGRVLGITEGLTAYLPEGTDVKAGDRILYDGDTYVINGEPKKWQGAYTRSNIQLNLIRWEG